MDTKLEKIVDKIKNHSLREKIIELIENPTIEIGGKVYSGLPLNVSPAGLSRHHSYFGGFLEHVASMTEIALTLCKVIKDVYGGKVDSDLVLSGIILHDIFKPLTYDAKEDGTYAITSLGERLDHLTLIVSEMIRRGFPLDLIHIVSAHHGWEAGPLGPRTIEALVCHLADITDSKLNGEVLRAASYLIRDVSDEEVKPLTSKEAFEIVNSKTVSGREGVSETIKNIRLRRSNAK